MIARERAESAPESAREEAGSSASAPPGHAVLALQRQIGNRATAQLVQRGVWNDLRKLVGASYEATVAGETVIVASKAEAQEAGEIIKRIKDQYGVDISSVRAVKATVDAYAKAPKKERDKVKTAPWLMRELRATERALKHYARILGTNRALSTRAGDAQEVTDIGKANLSITQMNEKGVIDPNTLGEYYRSDKTFAIYTPGEDYVQDLPTVDKQLEATIVHEIAHGVMYYALPEFTTMSGYWLDSRTKSGAKDAEPPCTKYGQTSAGEDLSETMRWYFMLPERLKKDCPKRYAWAKEKAEGWTPAPVKPPVGDFEAPNLPEGVALA
jgi:hypothetical protein